MSLDRSVPPSVGRPPSLRLPVLGGFELANGLSVHVVENHDLPVVSIAVHVRGGARLGTPGQAALLADMLDEGTTSRDAVRLAEDVERLGANLSTGAGYDAVVVGLGVLESRLDEALEILADVILNPAFEASELERVRRQRIDRIFQSGAEARTVADNVFSALLYEPSVPYGQPLIGTVESLEEIERADLVELYEETFRAGNMTVVVVGAVDAEALEEKMQAMFGALLPGDGPELGRQAARGVEELSVYLVDKPGAAQSEIRMGRVSVDRGTPDYFPLMVMNTLLGGSFTSRLNSNLREDKGYTYGASSGFAMRQEPGPFVAQSAVNTPVTDRALQEFVREVKRLAEEPVGPSELDRARSFLALRLPQRFETTGSVAGQIAEQVLNDLPADYYDTYMDQVMAVTADDVLRVARTHLDPGTMIMVVVGDLQVIEEGIRALGLGPVVVVPGATTTENDPGFSRAGE